MSRRSHRRVLGWVGAVALATLPTLALAQDVPDLAGIYELAGETLVKGQPDRFVITGKMVVKQNGTDCSTLVEAAIRRTAGASGPSSAALIGSGALKLDGRKLAGKIELQSLVSEIEELDVAMPFTPRTAGPILDARAEGQVLDDGSLALDVHSTVIAGESFLPEGRYTKVKATRVARKPTELKTKK